MIRMPRGILALFAMGLLLSGLAGIVLNRTAQSVLSNAARQSTADRVLETLEQLDDCAQQLKAGPSRENALACLQRQREALQDGMHSDADQTRELLNLQKCIDREQSNSQTKFDTRTTPRGPNAVEKETVPDGCGDLRHHLHMVRERQLRSTAELQQGLRATVLRGNRFIAGAIALQAFASTLVFYFTHRDTSLREKSAFEVLQTNLRLHAILTTMGEGLCQLDREGRLV